MSERRYDRQTSADDLEVRQREALDRARRRVAEERLVIDAYRRLMFVLAEEEEVAPPEQVAAMRDAFNRLEVAVDAWAFELAELDRHLHEGGHG